MGEGRATKEYNFTLGRQGGLAAELRTSPTVFGQKPPRWIFEFRILEFLNCGVVMPEPPKHNMRLRQLSLISYISLNIHRYFVDFLKTVCGYGFLCGFSPVCMWTTGMYWAHVHPYRALVRLLPCMPPHVDHQHVLRLERFLLSWAVPPLAHKVLLVGVDVVVGNMLDR